MTAYEILTALYDDAMLNLVQKEYDWSLSYGAVDTVDGDQAFISCYVARGGVVEYYLGTMLYKGGSDVLFTNFLQAVDFLSVLISAREAV